MGRTVAQPGRLRSSVNWAIQVFSRDRSGSSRVLILRTGVLEAFLFPRDTGNRTSLPARMFRQSVLELQEAQPS